MSKNTGVYYELITQKIFNAILQREDINTVEVKHDVTLKGKTTTHQIDVYWEFEKDGIKHTRIVQAKDWANPVNQGELLKFKAVLDDLPNQPHGVFVTRTGYHEGAVNVAKGNDILLYQLREVRESESQFRLDGGFIEFTIANREIADIRIVQDEKWTTEEVKRVRFVGFRQIHIEDRLNKIILYDRNGEMVMTLQELTNSFYPRRMKKLPPTKITHEFTEATFIKTGLAEIPMVKLKAVEAVISMRISKERSVFVPEDLIGFILENVLAGTKQTFDKQGVPQASTFQIP